MSMPPWLCPVTQRASGETTVTFPVHRCQWSYRVRSAQAGVQPDLGEVVTGPQLDQVAELVGQPDARARRVRRAAAGRVRPAGRRSGRGPSRRRSACRPATTDDQRPAPAAEPDAVRADLVQRQRQVVEPVPRHAVRRRLRGHPAPYRARARPARTPPLGPIRYVGQRRSGRPSPQGLPRRSDVAGRVDADGRLVRRRAAGTRGRVRERDVGSASCRSDLVVLGRAPARVGGFAETADRAPRCCSSSIAPERDQPRRVAPGNGHIDETRPRRAAGPSARAVRAIRSGGSTATIGFPRRQTVVDERQPRAARTPRPTV